jgi:hypothetical protein
VGARSKNTPISEVAYKRVLQTYQSYFNPI